MKIPFSILEEFLKIQQFLREATPEQRKELWAKLQEPYCKECGREDPNHTCRCWDANPRTPTLPGHADQLVGAVLATETQRTLRTNKENRNL